MEALNLVVFGLIVYAALIVVPSLADKFATHH